MGVFSKKNKSDTGGGAPPEDPNRGALFGSRKAGAQPAAANPYAQAPGNDPYSQPSQNPYQQQGRSSGYGGGGLPSNPRGGGGLPSGPSPRQQGGNPYGGAAPRSGNPYGGMDSGGDRYGGGSGGGYGAASSGGASSAGGGYGANRYGGGSGYGGDRYGTSSSGGGGGGSSRYGAGGYGGLGGGDRYGGGGQEDDGNRDALFGGAKDRIAERQQKQADGGSGAGANNNPYGQSGGGYGASYGDSGYGGEGGSNKFEDRELTAEEQEEEDVNSTKQQIRAMKQEDVSATRNALRMAQLAEETGRDTLARLGAQGEHIHSTEMNLDIAHNQNRIAEEKARELKTLNKSMFAVHVSNPFTAGSRARQRDQDVIDKHIDERDRREATRRAGFESDQRMQRAFQDVDAANDGAPPPRQRNLAERAKYQFEADSEDDEMENEIDANLDALGGAASRLNQLARATGREVEEQNKRLDIITEKSDRVDIGLASNQARLDRFR